MEHAVIAAMERLNSWLLGLPWVVERPGLADVPGLRWFAIDCEPLGRRRLWVLTGPLGDMAPKWLCVTVVLPASTALGIVDDGDGALTARIGDQHWLVSLRIDTTNEANAARLEKVLLIGYDASFG
jgi:hypothetical protein